MQSWLWKPHLDQGCIQFCSKILWMQYNNLTHGFLNLLYLPLTTEVVNIGRGCKFFSSLCFHSVYQWKPFCTAIVFKGYSVPWEWRSQLLFFLSVHWVFRIATKQRGEKALKIQEVVTKIFIRHFSELARFQAQCVSSSWSLLQIISKLKHSEMHIKRFLFFS